MNWTDNFFTHIAQTMKKFAKLYFRGSIIAGIIICVAGFIIAAFSGYLDDSFLPSAAILMLCIFCIVQGFVYSLLIYGFGELVERVQEIAANTRPAIDTSNTKASAEKAETIVAKAKTSAKTQDNNAVARAPKTKSKHSNKEKTNFLTQIASKSTKTHFENVIPGNCDICKREGMMVAFAEINYESENAEVIQVCAQCYNSIDCRLITPDIDNTLDETVE